MIKGNERRVVIVKGDKKASYEMACIFMREDMTIPQGDIVREAEEIIRRAQYERVGYSSDSKEEKAKRSGIGQYIAGVLSGAGLSYMIYAIIVFVFGYGM